MSLSHSPFTAEEYKVYKTLSEQAPLQTDHELYMPHRVKNRSTAITKLDSQDITTIGPLYLDQKVDDTKGHCCYQNEGGRHGNDDNGTNHFDQAAEEHLHIGGNVDVNCVHIFTETIDNAPDRGGVKEHRGKTEHSVEQGGVELTGRITPPQRLQHHCQPNEHSCGDGKHKEIKLSQWGRKTQRNQAITDGLVSAVWQQIRSIMPQTENPLSAPPTW